MKINGYIYRHQIKHNIYFPCPFRSLFVFRVPSCPFSYSDSRFVLAYNLQSSMVSLLPSCDTQRVNYRKILASPRRVSFVGCGGPELQIRGHPTTPRYSFLYPIIKLLDCYIVNHAATLASPTRRPLFLLSSFRAKYHRLLSLTIAPTFAINPQASYFSRWCKRSHRLITREPTTGRISRLRDSERVNLWSRAFRRRFQG